MDKVEILTALNENNRERNKANLKKHLESIYREVRDLKAAVLAGEKQLKQMSQEYQAKTEELEQIQFNMPKWAEDIAQAKERMIRQRGLTLKGMLEIQQEVARAEENQLLGEARALDLQNKLEAYAEERSGLQARIKELKAQFNKRAAMYNQEKARADLRLASYTSKEDALLAELDPESAAMYREALQSNPENPVVALEQDICGGCRIGLSKHIAKLVRQGDKLLRCENCMRILLPAYKEARED
jgi:predicted  nucleic acid-binding Zn-ribbon protein